MFIFIVLSIILRRLSVRYNDSFLYYFINNGSIGWMRKRYDFFPSVGQVWKKYCDILILTPFSNCWYFTYRDWVVLKQMNKPLTQRWNRKYFRDMVYFVLAWGVAWWGYNSILLPLPTSKFLIFFLISHKWIDPINYKPCLTSLLPYFYHDSFLKIFQTPLNMAPSKIIESGFELMKVGLRYVVNFEWAMGLVIMS